MSKVPHDSLDSQGVPASPPAASTALQRVMSGAPGTRDIVWKGAIVALVTACIVVPWIRFHLAPVAIDPDALSSGSPTRIALLLLWTVGMAYLGTLFFHALRYAPVPAGATASLPTVTVIVPAYNEGPMVRLALESALSSDYPAHLLEVLAIDDGSVDDTLAHIQGVARRHPGRVQVIAQPRNMGKREALHTGFLAAKGEVVVTVDSDSRLAPSALKHIVAPLMADPEVSAVAGKVLVLNRWAGLLTRLLAARFFITFDLCRAAQSRFGAVLCCPGALTAYRRSAVLSVLDRWMSQTFLGAPCTIGEDRALTTWLLRDGGRAVYQSTATVHTLVPQTLKGVTRMLLRWERGNLREDLVMLPVLFTRWRPRDRWWPTLEIALELIQAPIAGLLLFTTVRHMVLHPSDMLRLVATVGIVSLVQSLWVWRAERSTDFLYGVGYGLIAAIGLPWVTPWSLLTVRDGRWLTR